MRKFPWVTAMTVLAAAVLVGCASGNTEGGAAPQPAGAPSSSQSPADVAEGDADSSESVESSEPASSQETAGTPSGMDWTVDLPDTLTFESAVAHVHGAVLRDRSLLVATHDGLTSVVTSTWMHFPQCQRIHSVQYKCRAWQQGSLSDICADRIRSGSVREIV